MTDNTEKLAALSSKAEVKADYLLTHLVAFPYSWIVGVIVIALATYGALRLIGG